MDVENNGFQVTDLESRITGAKPGYVSRTMFAKIGVFSNKVVTAANAAGCLTFLVFKGKIQLSL